MHAPLMAERSKMLYRSGRHFGTKRDSHAFI